MLTRRESCLQAKGGYKEGLSKKMEWKMKATCIIQLNDEGEII